MYRKYLTWMLMALFFTGLAQRSVFSQSLPQTSSCKHIDGLAALLQPGSVLLLGEVHGTVESPAVAAAAVCLALEAHRSVTLALEIPREEAPRLLTFLSSDGAESGRTALLTGRFWQPEERDGRSSAAILALLEEVRNRQHSGQPVKVEPFDRVDVHGAQDRERAMAEQLKAAAEAAPQNVLVVLAGNVHTRVTRGVPWNERYEPMGFLLTHAAPNLRVTSLDIAYSQGSAWFCMNGCKVQPLHGHGDDQGWRVILDAGHSKEGHNGVYNVGMVTPSLPAVKTAEEHEAPRSPK